MIEELYENLGIIERENFQRIVNLLLGKTFIVYNIYDENKKTSVFNPDYRFVEKNFELFEKYLNLVDITDIKWMAIHHPISMSQNPMDIKNFIENNIKDGKTNQEIKDILMNDFEKYFTL